MKVNPSDNIHDEIRSLCCRESGRILAGLVKIFGVKNLEIAEEVMEEVVLIALNSWEEKGIPPNPAAWLGYMAKSRTMDTLHELAENGAKNISSCDALDWVVDGTLFDRVDFIFEEANLEEAFVEWMFICCHWEITPEQRATSLLHWICGFTPEEIAIGLGMTEVEVLRKISTAKEHCKLLDQSSPWEIEENIKEETEPVLGAIHKVYNSGFQGLGLHELMREDMMAQAMQLCIVLLKNPKTQLPETYALMALMCFHTARSDSRLSPEGELILSARQNRHAWDERLIEAANRYLNESAFGDGLTQFHLEAAIAFQHCSASSVSVTDWKSILGYYDILIQICPDPEVALNRAMVVMQLHGPEAALKEISNLAEFEPIHGYTLFHATLGAVHEKLGQQVEAAKCFVKAIGMEQSSYLKRLLNARVSTLLN